MFSHETLHVSDSSSVHHQEFIHCALSNGICHTDFEQDQDGTAVPSWSCSKAVYKPVWHIPLLSVQSINSWWWTEELTEILVCRVSCQNKFVKLVRLVDMLWHDIFVKCNWFDSGWQQYSTHLHTNNTQNDTKQTIHRTTQQFGGVRAVPRLG